MKWQPKPEVLDWIQLTFGFSLAESEKKIGWIIKINYNIYKHKLYVVISIKHKVGNKII